MIALNQFAHMATQKDPITVKKIVIVSSIVNGKYSSILPRSENSRITRFYPETMDKPCANRLRSLPGGFTLKNLIGDFNRPARAIS